MKTTDAAYLAGLIDGEGCISVMRLSRGKSRPSHSFMARIQVAMTAKNIVLWCKNITKVGSVHKKPQRLKHHKDQWVWTANGPDAITVAGAILPFLRLKNRQAENILEFQEKAHRSKAGGPALSHSEILLRTKYYKRSRKLNGGRTSGQL